MGELTLVLSCSDSQFSKSDPTFGSTNGRVGSTDGRVSSTDGRVGSADGRVDSTDGRVQVSKFSSSGSAKVDTGEYKNSHCSSGTWSRSQGTHMFLS